MSNPFDLLGNDVEDSTSEILVTKELTRNSGSSKKSDVNPKADKSKAKKRTPSPNQANENALKTKNINNKIDPAATANQKQRSNNKSKFDKHNKSGKTDSSKKVKKGWGDDKKEGEFEKEAEQDAKLDETVDAVETLESEEATSTEPKEPTVPKKSLAEYLAEQQKAQNALNSKNATKASVESVEHATKLEKDLIEDTVGSNKKQPRSKNLKTKEYLEFDITFQDSVPTGARDNNNRQRREGNNNRERKPFGGKDNRQRKEGNNKNTKPENKQGANVAQFAKKELNFPSLA
ncbi:hypothetical protein ACO0RG_002601 [Hanseniaspora osmophila]|uniref:Suppressor protein STM1 n=1 Tax=Hanseniaspora osmophila TaxID=56408 RepID=A0A1E5RW43_9ASCO|nr:Suppressor protein STM1 [Hanseniaspora osmophila]